MGLVLLSLSVWSVSGQGGEEGQFEEVLISTSGSNVVGVGNYVAGEAYAVAAGEDPAEEPMQALILPYAIYPNMHVAAIEDFVQPDPAVEGFTFEWSLAVPDGSAAEVMQGTVGIFMADVEGTYDLMLTAADADGNSAEAVWTIHATTYVGNGYLDGPESAEDQCIDCHEERTMDWAATGHADMLVRALEGDRA